MNPKKTANRSWTAYPSTYRAREMKILAGWIASGESGSVVGLLGSGRSNLLGFLCYRAEILQSYLPPQAMPAVLIPVDLNNLPASNLSTVYRVILRAFHRVRHQFDQVLQQKISDLYQETRAEPDPFLAQSALQELLSLCQTQPIQVILVLNRFDSFCQAATPQMVNTLRGLRDDFKDTLCYIVGATQEVAYWPNPEALGDMYELLDNYVCWVGTLTGQDARNLIARATYAAPVPPTETDIAAMLALTGGYPSLLRSLCQWWLTTENRLAHDKWLPALLAERSIQHRLAELWSGLTQEEQFIVSELQKLQTARRQTPARNGQSAQHASANGDKTFQEFGQQQCELLAALMRKGVCCRTEMGWQVSGELVAAYVAQVEGRGRGRIWLDEKTGEIYQGQTLLQDLTALEKAVLAFLIKYPRISHTKTDVIVNAWPDELRQQGVTDNSLYQVILTLRKKIEPNPTVPAYLITWRGKPEGGYQFFPEGRPK